MGCHQREPVGLAMEPLDTLVRKGHEIQTGCMSERFDIRNANKHHFVSARLQLARERSHGIQFVS
jgi:hypothetical protein